MYCNTNEATYIYVYGAAIIIDNARNYVLAFKIWQTHATNIRVIRVH